MLKHKSRRISGSFLYILLFSIGFFVLCAGDAGAVETLRKGAPAQVGPLPGRTAPLRPVGDGLLIVENIEIDETAQNAVLARDAAMAAARRAAFRQLAARYMTPAAAEQIDMPDDRTLAALVNDFEIIGEQLSATRYVARFNVRFRDHVRRYIPVAGGAAYPTPHDYPTPLIGTPVNRAGMAAYPPAATATTQIPPVREQRSTLVLPYLENETGKVTLWGDQNPWRAMWQREVPAATPLQRYVVPVGDIGDMAAGPETAVWTGDYRPVEKLRNHYKADDVVVAVAKRDGTYLTIDMYFLAQGRLRGREVLQPHVGVDTPADAVYRHGMMAVADLLGQKDRAGVAGTAAQVRQGGRVAGGFAGDHRMAGDTARDTARGGFDRNFDRSRVAEISQSLITSGGGRISAPPVREWDKTLVIDGRGDRQQAAPSPAPPLQTGDATRLNAALRFNQFATWMDFQRRIAGVQPPVLLDIRSLSRNSAQFTMRFDGGIDRLQSELAARGVMLSRPETPFGDDGIYNVQLVN